MTIEIDFEQERKALGQRSPLAHKGDFGHVCLIGAGHSGYAGALCLAGEAALRAGAGRVSAVAHVSALWRMNKAPAELMCYSAEDDFNESMTRLLKTATIIVLGPGLSQSPWAISIFNQVLDFIEKANLANLPLVLDADALNILAGLNIKKNHWILTPHPGEAARLLSVSAKAIQNDRLGAIQALEKKWGGVIVLKGANTLVYTQGEPVVQCNAGNPGMASGGMGDVLAGLIGGLLAQGLSPYAAAKLGVITHAMAADRQQKAGQRGMLASDLFSDFRSLLN